MTSDYDIHSAEMRRRRRVEPELSPKFEQRLRWMETESRFAHACPDLDQEYPTSKAQIKRQLDKIFLDQENIPSKGRLMFPIVHSMVGWFLAFAIICGVAVAIKIILDWSH